MEKEDFVPNDVFKYRVSLRWADDISVYVKPFPKPWDEGYKEEEALSLEDKKRIVREKYFSADRIEELKRKVIEAIMEEDNPFDIYCTDTDSGYLVTEEQLFEI